MGDERLDAPAAMRELNGILKARYPGAIKVINESVVPTAASQFMADRYVSPKYADLQQDVYKQQALPAARTAVSVDDLVQRAAAKRELDIAKGTGGAMVTQADLLQKRLDPEFYAQREQLGSSIAQYLKASDPSLTENEREEIRRGLGRTSTNPNSAIDTATKAMQFGEKSREKTALFGQAISNVAAALPAMRSGMDAIGIATGRNLNASTGQDKVMDATTNAGSNAWSFANNYLNTAGGVTQTAMGKALSLIDKLDAANRYIATSADVAGKIIGGIAACWVAIECFGEGSTEWYIWKHWLLTEAPGWFRRLYIKHGEAFANWLHTKPVMRELVKAAMYHTVIKSRIAYAY